MITISRKTAAACIELWRDRGNLQLGLAKTCTDSGQYQQALTHCNWARESFDVMDELQAALNATPSYIGSSHYLYTKVPESFYLFTPLNEDHFQEAFRQANQTPGSAVFAQVVNRNGLIRLQGACFTPEYADQINSIINNWRIYRGVPQNEHHALQQEKHQ